MVVVPAAKAEMVYSIAHGREVIEEIVKEELTKNPGPPGRFYPFVSGKIKVDSPLGAPRDEGHHAGELKPASSRARRTGRFLTPGGVVPKVRRDLE